MKVLETLTIDQCFEQKELVLKLQSHWESHGSDPDHPYFYTLGVPFYSRPLESYFKATPRFNPLIHQHFSPLLGKVAKLISSELRIPVKVSNQLAFPGFHIYTKPMPQGGTVHFDLVTNSVIENFPEVIEGPLGYSFTLPLSLPEAGAGLNFWNYKYPLEIQLPENLSPKGPFQEDFIKLSLGDPEYIPYQLGKIYFFESHFLHQVAPSPILNPGEFRLTLQGHLVKSKAGYWIMFW
jgi:hypothetical protein